MEDLKLSPHFTLFELTRTDNRAYIEVNRDVPNELLMNGYALAASLLEPIRVHYNKPLIVHSGYRSPGLNEAIGGSKTSQHMSFQAADFHVNGVDLEEVFNWIWKESNLRFGQLIGEGQIAGKFTWIHLSLGAPWSNKNNEVLTWSATDGYKRIQ